MTAAALFVDTDRVPRIARVVAVGAPHHVTQRGNNRQKVFFSAADRRIYLLLLGSHCHRWKLTLLGYCLMPNHVHLVAVPEQETSLAKAVGRTNYEYAVYLNGRRRRSEYVWQNRFYSTSLSRDHLVAALRYVDLNPVRAGLVVEAVSYEWSSAAAHVTGKDRRAYSIRGFGVNCVLSTTGARCWRRRRRTSSSPSGCVRQRGRAVRSVARSSSRRSKRDYREH